MGVFTHVTEIKLLLLLLLLLLLYIAIAWSTIKDHMNHCISVVALDYSQCPELCALIHYLMSCLNPLPIRTLDLFCYQAQLSTVLHWLVCCVG